MTGQKARVAKVKIPIVPALPHSKTSREGTEETVLCFLRIAKEL